LSLVFKAEPKRGTLGTSATCYWRFDRSALGEVSSLRPAMHVASGYSNYIRN
jgi:hypothetical protein